MIIMSINCSLGSVSRTGSLFVVGRSALLGSDFASGRVAVAGSRKIDHEHSALLRDMVNTLDPAKNVLVSGLALGADGVAHRAALARGVPQIVVLPSGFDRVTPRSHLPLLRSILSAGGCAVSLLPPQASPSRSSFVARNEVIARLGKVLFVPQCASASGTMHTVRFARSAGVPVFFCRSGAPHLVGVPGCFPK